jgi:ADP-ribose pyrophosphatase
MAIVGFARPFRVIVRSIPACTSSEKLPILDTVSMPQRRAEIPAGLAYIVAMPKSDHSKKRKTARVLSSRLVYRGPVFWVTSERVREPSGVRVLREVVRHTGSVVILATEDGPREPLVLLERQYRHAANSYLWELPAGRIDKGEKALSAAKRELLEETGYTARNWKQILKFFASPGFVAEPMTVFWARGLRSGPAQPEPDEVIDQHLVALSKAVNMVLRGTIRDAKTISSVLWLALREKGRKAHK